MGSTDISPTTWIFAGLASSFPNIEPSSTPDQRKTKLGTTSSYPPDSTPDSEPPPPPPCKIIQCNGEEVKEVTADEAQVHIGFKPQALVFQYRNKFHAMDHACPHRTYSLSRGSVYDIEDFGIVLSAGITCPGHGWAFDLFTGEADRGTYRLALWDVEVRAGEEEDEVWVRRKESIKKRIG